MKPWVWVAVSVLILSALGGVAEAQQTSVLYRLQHFEGGTWVEYFPGNPFPAGGGTAGTNTWRYIYELCHLQPGFGSSGLNELNVFFNSDNVLRATWSSASAPANWTATKVGPAAPNNNWRCRYRTLVTASRIASGTCNNLFIMTFTWVGNALPGVQNYDAISTSGSDAGTTVAASPVPVAPVSWGLLKKRVGTED